MLDLQFLENLVSLDNVIWQLKWDKSESIKKFGDKNTRETGRGVKKAIPWREKKKMTCGGGGAFPNLRWILALMLMWILLVFCEKGDDDHMSNVFEANHGSFLAEV